MPAAKINKGADMNESRSPLAVSEDVSLRPVAAESPARGRVKLLNLDKERGASSVGRKWVWRLLWLSVFLVVGAAAYAKFSQSSVSWLAGTLPIVETHSVESELSRSIVLYLAGYASAKTSVEVNPRIPGTITVLPIEEGAKVARGELLAQLDDAEYQFDYASAQAQLAQAQAKLDEAVAGPLLEEVEQARALLRQAEARLEQAEAQHERLNSLKASISPQELEMAKATYLEAKASVAHHQQSLKLLEKGPRNEQIAMLKASVSQAQSAVKKAEYWLACTRVFAPVEGTIIEKSRDLGENIGPESLGQPLCIIADLDKLEVEVDIQERDLASVAIGQLCRITPEAYPDRFYEGRLARILPIANRQRGVVPARIQVVNPDALLLPDMSCRVSLLEDGAAVDADDRLRVPVQAVSREEKEAIVYVLDGYLARRRVVELDPDDDDSDGFYVVSDRLFPGEVVLLPKNDVALRDGQPVMPASPLSP
jgi:RND family efflux transporter MFP subunit